jgi:hypothetical protein
MIDSATVGIYGVAVKLTQIWAFLPGMIIGSTFLKDIQDNKLLVGDVDLSSDYYIHFEGMSWYKNKFDKTKEDTGIDFGGTHNNPTFIKAHEQKYFNFLTIKQKYDSVKITDRFTA